MFGAHKQIKQRLDSLEQHLRRENPLLTDAVHSFRRLDRIGYRTGLLADNQSFATRISWWPLISVLGTFSAGKSTFINAFLGNSLQKTGNQAVDDKFTVVCYASDGVARVLPGIALDADPRFPFYQISEELEKVESGQGGRVDAYLQLKTCASENLKGRIVIDSPGFDADEQRNATLRITDHIIELSDLVIVMFDARHPEPGAMHDTLVHLVAKTIGRKDSSKFLYVLNQIDTAAREDNPEEVIAAWQRALAQKGLTAGRFYCVYNSEAAVPIEDAALRQRFETKRDNDMQAIGSRIQQVSVERAYRIIAELEKQAREIEDTLIPRLRDWIARWARLTMWSNLAVFTLLLGGLFGLSLWAGYWEGLRFNPPWLGTITGSLANKLLSLGLGLSAVAGIHYLVRRLTAGRVRKRIARGYSDSREREDMLRAFNKNTRFWRSCLDDDPAGWGRRSRSLIAKVLLDADRFVQELNDRFTDPSGAGVSRDDVANIDDKVVSARETEAMLASRDEAELAVEKQTMQAADAGMNAAAEHEYEQQALADSGTNDPEASDTTEKNPEPGSSR